MNSIIVYRPNMIKALIFDFGSVMYRTNWECMDHHFFQQHGFHIRLGDLPDEKLLEAYRASDTGKGDLRSFFLCLQPTLTKKKLDAVLRTYHQCYIHCKIVNHDLLRWIRELKKSYSLFGFTDVKQEHYAANIEAGIYKEFIRIFTSFEFQMTKAEPGAFSKLIVALTSYHLSPSECVFIDDYLPNIEHAQKTGFHTIHYTSFPDIQPLQHALSALLHA
ncbi:MAG: HAD-IA family hydrolase [Nanoarchaeota archaeon]